LSLVRNLCHPTNDILNSDSFSNGTVWKVMLTHQLSNENRILRGGRITHEVCNLTEDWALSIPRRHDENEPTLGSADRHIDESLGFFRIQKLALSLNGIKNHCMPFAALSAMNGAHRNFETIRVSEKHTY